MLERPDRSLRVSRCSSLAPWCRSNEEASAKSWYGPTIGTEASRRRCIDRWKLISENHYAQAGCGAKPGEPCGYRARGFDECFSQTVGLEPLAYTISAAFLGAGKMSLVPIFPAAPVGPAARAPTWLTPISWSLPQLAGGSTSALSLSRPAQASLALRPVGSLSRPKATFVARLQPSQLPSQAARQLPDPIDNCPGGTLLH